MCSGKKDRNEIEFLEKKSIIYGESKVSERSYKRKSIYDWNNVEEYLGYSPDDFPGYRQPPPMREFRSYIEKYLETYATKKSYQQIKAKLLKKYGGIQFKDDNDDRIYTINPSYCE